MPVDRTLRSDPFEVSSHDSDSPAAEGCDELGDTCSEVDAYYVREVEPVLHLVNPTSIGLTAYIVVFDNSGSALACRVRDLGPNDFTDVMLGDLSGNANEFGVVKIVVFDSDDRGVTVQAGLIGWIAHYMEQETYEDIAVTRESALIQVPHEVLFADLNPEDDEPDELSLIVEFVDKNCVD